MPLERCEKQKRFSLHSVPRPCSFCDPVGPEIWVEVMALEVTCEGKTGAVLRHALTLRYLVILFYFEGFESSGCRAPYSYQPLHYWRVINPTGVSNDINYFRKTQIASFGLAVILVGRVRGRHG